MRKIECLLIIALVLGSLYSCQSNSGSVIGVKCYQLPDTPQQTIKQWQALGINTVYASEELCRNTQLRTLAMAAEIDFYLIFPVFYNPEALAQDSSLWAITSQGQRAKADWVEFVCPSDSIYRRVMVDKAKRLVEELHPEGLSIDFIRHFNFWEMVGPDTSAEDLTESCFCEHCLSDFQQKQNVLLPGRKTSEVAEYIHEHYQAQWEYYKCQLITSMVSSLTRAVKTSQPSIKTNLHAVPWRLNDYEGASHRVVGQNLVDLAPMVDYISPMCYTHMLRRHPLWVDSLVCDFQQQGVVKVLPCVQVSKSYRSDDLRVDSFNQCIEAGNASQRNGIVFWSWEMLYADAKKQEAIKLLLN